MFPGFAAVLAAACLRLVSAAFQTNAWQNVGEEFTFPEMQYPEVQSKPNVGVTFSGGGSRSYTLTTGTLAAFHELGMMGNVKYIAGSSGGSWGIGVYSFYQHSTVSDSTMLGPVVFPVNITYAGLQQMEENCVRNLTNVTYPYDQIVYFEDWVTAVQSIYYTPSGVFHNVPFSFNNESVAGIKAANPQLQDTDFILPRGTDTADTDATTGIDPRPYAIIQATLIGPFDMMPWEPSNRNYSMVEWTPLTAGVAYTRNVTFRTVNDTSTQNLTVGGFIDPFAFNSSAAPSTGLPAGEASGVLEVPESRIFCDVALASGTSSWAVGEDIAASKDHLIEKAAGRLNYWAPAAADPSAEYQLYSTGDGAGVSNTDLISLLQRNVSQIIAFVNTDTPMLNSTHWDPNTMPLMANSMDFTVPAWFGQIAENLTVGDMDTYDLVNSQVFADDEWLPFINAMQAAQATNNGIVVSLTHTTAANPRYGLPAGRTVKVLWVYNGRVINWENQLDAEMRGYLTPVDDPDNQANTVKTGPFANFPWYITKLDSIFTAQANLLADLGGWLVYQHQDLFLEALGMESEPTDDPDTTSSSGDDDNGFVDSDAGIGTLTAVALVAVGLLCYVLYRCGFIGGGKAAGGSLQEPLSGEGAGKGRESVTELAGSKNPMGADSA